MNKSDVEQVEDYLGIEQPVLGEYRLQKNGILEYYSGNNVWVSMGTYGVLGKGYGLESGFIEMKTVVSKTI